MLLACFLLVGASCDKWMGSGGDDEPADEDAREGVEKDAQRIEEDAKEEAVAEARGEDEQEDEGSLSVTIGDDLDWTVQRVRVRGSNTVAISASQSRRVGTKRVQEELKLYLRDYDGPGEYKLLSPSGFIGVGLDVNEFREAGDDEAKHNEAVKKASTKATNLTFAGGTVTVTADDGEFIDGTFEWTPPPEQKRPSFTNGKFHAKRSGK